MNECSIVRDLLPLYAEDMVSAETADFVAGHLEKCSACQEEYEREKQAPELEPADNGTALRRLSRKLRAAKVHTIVLTALFVAALCASAFAVLTAPIYLPYGPELVECSVTDDGIEIMFDDSVADFECIVWEADTDDEAYYCSISAWTSTWDEWFSKRNQRLSGRITLDQTKPTLVEYDPKNGEESHGIVRYDPHAQPAISPLTGRVGWITLPRLSLAAVLMLSIGALVILGIVWLVNRRRPKTRTWIERVALYPASLIVGLCIVSGMDWPTYSLPRDLALTVLISLLLYGGMLLAYNVYRTKRELKEMER